MNTFTKTKNKILTMSEIQMAYQRLKKMKSQVFNKIAFS